MRIGAGEHRGRVVVAPKGHSTRPTADRVREAVFNILEHAAWSGGPRGARVIDLFAGSGALGLEAISRGAAFCLFVDNALAAVSAIAENIGKLRVEGLTAVRLGDARQLGSRSPDLMPPANLVFLDPPYGSDFAQLALTDLAGGGWLAPGAIAVVERGASEIELQAPGFEPLDTRVWGAARVCFLRASGTST